MERKKHDTCKIEVKDLGSIKARLPKIAEDIIESCSDEECYTHIDYEPIPSKEGVIDIGPVSYIGSRKRPFCGEACRRGIRPIIPHQLIPVLPVIRRVFDIDRIIIVMTRDVVGEIEFG